MIGVDEASFKVERTQFKDKLAGLEKELPTEIIKSKSEVVIKTNEAEENFHVVIFIWYKDNPRRDERLTL